MSDNFDFDFSERTQKQIDYAKLFNTIPCVTDGYISPIQTIASQIVMTRENAIYKAVQRVGVDVNKDELVKALEYDRGQYEKGYKNGYKDGYAKGIEDCLAKIGTIVKGGDDNERSV